MQIKIQFGPSRLFLSLLLHFTFSAVTISPTPQNAALFCAFEYESFSLCCGGHSIFSLVVLQTAVLISCKRFNYSSSILINSDRKCYWWFGVLMMMNLRASLVIGGNSFWSRNELLTVHISEFLWRSLLEKKFLKFQLIRTNSLKWCIHFQLRAS